MKRIRRMQAVGFAMLAVTSVAAPSVASPSEAQKLISYGQRYVRLTDDRTASICFTRAIMADPSNLQARRLLAQCQLRAGFARNAEDIMQTCVRADPSADNLACLGDARFALGRIEPARAAYTQALVQQPLHASATLGLINVCVAAQQYDTARQLCRATLAQTKDGIFCDALRKRLAELEQYGQAPPKQEG